jgi:hypothetical protein
MSLWFQHCEEMQGLLQHQEQPSNVGSKKEVENMSLLVYNIIGNVKLKHPFLKNNNVKKTN